MHKKGFTLIELLAVIVILAIIALIATPMILGVIETSRKGAAESSALGYIDAVEKQVAINELDSTKEKLSDGVYEISELKDTKYGITIKGNIPSDGWIKISNGKVFDYGLKIDDYIIEYDVPTHTYEITKNGELIDYYVCKRATELHTDTCLTDNCVESGYTNGEIITYGNESVTDNVLNSGDAFDCDVDGDGLYGEKDEATGKYLERFYYVSKIDGDAESNIAVLIYYNNTISGISGNTNLGLIAYDTSSENWHGPVTAINNLPTVSQWKNIKLMNSLRMIKTENNNTSVNGNLLPTNFSYKEYAARLMTYQELESGCNITISSENGELNKCNYLLENTKYSSNTMGTYGYWLETPRSSDSNNAWRVFGDSRRVYFGDVGYAVSFGVRPVIEVLESQILY